MTCPRKHSRQNVCPQDSGRMIKSSCISSKHMPHTNNRRVVLARRMVFACRVDLASSVGCAEKAQSSLLDSCCGLTAHGTLSSRSEGGIGGSARPELERANGKSGYNRLRVEINTDGRGEWRVDEETCLCGAAEDDPSCCCWRWVTSFCRRFGADASLVSLSKL